MRKIVVFRNLFYLIVGATIGRGLYFRDFILVGLVVLALVCHWLLLLSAVREIHKQIKIIKDELKLETE